MAALRKLIPQMLALTDLGKQLAAAGKITVDYGDDYSSAALQFFMREHGITTGRISAAQANT